MSMIGRNIGPYHVTGSVGAGGMGEVYRATDSRLSRDVAIKVLPAVFAEDAERMARFDREARLLASLSHANIASIYGLEDTDGTRAIVMELVDGETLADRIGRGPISVEDTLSIAKQIAEALEYAHEHGVIHRDLKPANIKITADGSVKVLDFGLAKALDDDPTLPGSDMTKSPTLTSAGTRVGVILGTAAYMSPEQAKGRAVDRRADIFAFGALLYEMLTGKQAFTGETVSETLASVMKDDPDLDALPAAAPATLRELIRRCLLKDPKQRLRDIGEARIAIERIARGESGLSGVFAPASGESRPARAARASVGRLLAIVLPAALVAGLAGWMFHRASPAPLYSVDLTLPQGFQLDLQDASLVLSPDGRSLAVAGALGGTDQKVWVRRLDGQELTPLDGTQDATYPTWSPDGRSIAFFASGKLKRVPATGGVVQTICNASDGRGIAWNREGDIVFAPGALDGLNLVPASGGTPHAVTKLEKKGDTHRLPQFLPGGERLLYTIGNVTGDSTRVMCLDVKRQTQKLVMEGTSEARYLNPGYLMYVHDGTLFVRPFDVDALKFTGDPIPLADKVQFNHYRFTGNYALADRGPMVYLAGDVFAKEQLTWFDLNGNETGLLGHPAAFANALAISPDGSKVAVAIRGDHIDIWLIDVATGVESRFTLGAEPAAFPVWSPDGREIAYGNGSGSIWAQSVDGATPRRHLLDRKDISMWPVRWSADGKVILCNVQQPGTGIDIWLLPADGSGAPKPFLETRNNEYGLGLSPDGRWILYGSDASGRAELYAALRTDSTTRFQISNEGARAGLWAPDGKSIYYVTPGGNVQNVAVDAAGSGISLGAARKVFGGKPVGDPGALAPDGKHLLMAIPEGAGQTTLRLVTDWRALARPRKADR